MTNRHEREETNMRTASIDLAPLGIWIAEVAFVEGHREELRGIRAPAA
jgi:hypothetical protein